MTFAHLMSSRAVLCCSLLVAAVMVDGFSVPRTALTKHSVAARRGLRASSDGYDLDLSDVDLSTPAPSQKAKKTKPKKPTEPVAVKEPPAEKKAKPPAAEKKKAEVKKPELAVEEKPKKKKAPPKVPEPELPKKAPKPAPKPKTKKPEPVAVTPKPVAAATSSSTNGVAGTAGVGAAGLGGFAAFRSQLEKGKEDRELSQTAGSRTKARKKPSPKKKAFAMKGTRAVGAAKKGTRAVTRQKRLGVAGRAGGSAVAVAKVSGPQNANVLVGGGLALALAFVVGLNPPPQEASNLDTRAPVVVAKPAKENKKAAEPKAKNIAKDKRKVEAKDAAGKKNAEEAAEVEKKKAAKAKEEAKAVAAKKEAKVTKAAEIAAAKKKEEAAQLKVREEAAAKAKLEQAAAETKAVEPAATEELAAKVVATEEVAKTVVEEMKKEEPNVVTATSVPESTDAPSDVVKPSAKSDPTIPPKLKIGLYEIELNTATVLGGTAAVVAYGQVVQEYSTTLEKKKSKENGTENSGASESDISEDETVEAVAEDTVTDEEEAGNDTDETEDKGEKEEKGEE